MHLKDHLKLWNHAYIHVIDIRRTSFDARAKAPTYQLPASAFLYAANGGARVLLDKKPYLFNHAHILHGGKGMVIEFFLEKEGLEYYLILYKAILALPARKELVALMEQHNPFYSQYGFEPQSPVSLYRTAEDMMNSWRTSGPLEQLHVKTLFYQWIYELAWQLHSQGVQMMKPNLLEQAIRYMETHYREALSLEQLAEAVGSSPRTLSRLLKTRLHSTPAQYLISFRMKQAKALLLNTDATLQEIALDTGYPDAYYLGKMFKKYFGISPMRFKSKYRFPHLWPDMTSVTRKK